MPRTSSSEKKVDHLYKIRHSLAHLTAASVQKFWPDTKFGIGPVIDNGFYYDFKLPKTFTPDDLKKIERHMRGLIAEKLSFKRIKIKSPDEAMKLALDQEFKIELIEELIQKKEPITFYQVGDFIDLCRGGHVDSTDEIAPDSFQLSHVSGAYWRGDEKNPMLQRIYGLAFQNKEDLRKYLHMLEEAKKRDHRKLGAKLDLFSSHAEAPGMPFFHPKGMVIYKELLSFTRRKLFEYEYEEVRAPNVLDVALWKQSGHYDHYKDNMYFIPEEGQQFALRPMDCPGTILIYKSRLHSYREFPLRMAETGVVFRKERSGVVGGLFRVTQITQDDAHIFLQPKQIFDEISNLLKLVDETYRTFDLSYTIHLSTRPDDFMGDVKIWNEAEDALKKAVTRNKRDYVLNSGDGAFYGPKLDFWVKDSLGRNWQCATVQLDFQMPIKFDLEYNGADGRRGRPVIIHRTIMGSYERFLGVLIEHYAGAFPLWLSPVQIALLPVADRHGDFAQALRREFRSYQFRADVDVSPETVGNKIRKAAQQKIPYILVLGDKEMDGTHLTIKERGKDGVESMTRSGFIEKIQREISERK